MEILGTKYSGKPVYEKLFSKTTEENRHLCKICNQLATQNLKNGYHNLYKHLNLHLKTASEDEKANLKRTMDGDQAVIPFKMTVTKFKSKIYD
jgi:hypothetical protein